MNMHKMERIKNSRLTITLKGAALIALVEEGIIPRDENGGIDAEPFERFWARFDRNLNAQITDELNEVRKVAEECANDRRSKGHFQCKIAIISAAAFFLGCLLAQFF